MKCQNCGTDVQENEQVCHNCSYRVVQSSFLEGTRNVSQYEQVVENTFNDAPKRKMSKGKKVKIIAIVVSVGIFALAITLAILFFSSAAYRVYGNMKSDDFEDALTEYRYEVKDNFIQEILLNRLLKNRVSEVEIEYKNGDIDYDTAIAELNALDEMGFDGAKKKIDEITVSNDSVNALAKADEYYENGDYAHAALEYSKIPESDENYGEAQKKLKQTYVEYISYIVSTANEYLSFENYRQAIQVINEAYDILPDTTDTTELDAIKEECLMSYEVEVANEVTELTENENWSEAFDLINEAISVDDNEYFRNLKSTTEADFVSITLKKVDTLMSERDYTSAKTAINEAIKLLPNNSILNDKLAEIEKKAPVSLATLTPINGGWEWNKGMPMDSFGTSYTDVCNYAIFAGGDFFYGNHEVEYSAEYRNQGKYKVITGSLLPHSDIPEDGFGCLQIYADDKLVYTSERINRKTDMINFSATIEGSDYIKLVILASNGSVWGYTTVDSLLMMDVQLWSE